MRRSLILLLFFYLKGYKAAQSFSVHLMRYRNQGPNSRPFMRKMPPLRQNGEIIVEEKGM